MRLIFIFVLFFAMSTMAADSPKLVPVSYETEICSCKGIIDSSVISAKKVENSFKLQFFPTFPKDSFDSRSLVKTNIEEIKRIIDKTNASYAAMKKDLASLELPEGKRWEEIRKVIFKQIALNQFLELGELYYYLNKDSKHLLSDFEEQKIAAECVEHAQALQDPEALKTQAQKIVEKSCQRNLNPKTCMIRAAAENPIYNVLVFGWKNCVNSQFHSKYNDSPDLKNAILAVEKKIKNLKCECDEP